MVSRSRSRSHGFVSTSAAPNPSTFTTLLQADRTITGMSATASRRRLSAKNIGPSMTGIIKGPLAPPEFIHEYAQRLSDADGTEYVVRVYGQPRRDGTWIGWLEFVATGTATVLRTDRETTQSSRDELAYWATGLEPTYFEGAFGRARKT